MQVEMFPLDQHDAGGKVKSPLPPGVRGSAVFHGENSEYRTKLCRWVGGETFPSRYVLFIGMNPSTADALVSDPTVSREWAFTQRWGYGGYVKCNIADYRATFPRDLLEPGVTPSSQLNLPTILEEAVRADRVVLCHGKLNRALEAIGRDVVKALRSQNVQMMCFGKNGDGSPKHPLYLRSDAPLVDFTG